MYLVFLEISVYKIYFKLISVWSVADYQKPKPVSRFSSEYYLKRSRISPPKDAVIIEVSTDKLK